MLLVILVLITGGILLNKVQRNTESNQSQSTDTVSSRPTVMQPKPQGNITGSDARNFDSTNQIPLVVSEPTNNQVVTVPTVTVSGTTASNADVFVNDQQLKADTQGKFSTSIHLDEGDNTIIIVTNDAMGNSLEKDIVVTYNTGQIYQ